MQTKLFSLRISWKSSTNRNKNSRACKLDSSAFSQEKRPKNCYLQCVVSYKSLLTQAARHLLVVQQEKGWWGWKGGNKNFLHVWRAWCDVINVRVVTDGNNWSVTGMEAYLWSRTNLAWLLCTNIALNLQDSRKKTESRGLGMTHHLIHGSNRSILGKEGTSAHQHAV